MESKQEPWPLLTFKEYEKDINPTPTYQRSSVWELEQKQLLVDSILRKIDIPKIYLREVTDGKYQYEIIDGQQRMRAIWDFLNGEFPLSDEAEHLLVKGKEYEVAEKSYEELESVVRIERVHKYHLDVVIIYDASEDEIADLFYRLNNGTPLSPAEVRNSMPGAMKIQVKELAAHPFMTKASFSNRRFAYDQICAQMMMLQLNSGLADTRDRTLSKMYSEFKKKSVPQGVVQSISDTLDVLDKVFPEKSRLLNRASTINLFLLLSYLRETTKLTKSFYPKFLDWYLQTEPIRRKDHEYRLYMTSSANSRASIEGRFRMIVLDLYKQFQSLSIVELDPQRLFSETMKAQIYARDKGICQNCSRKVNERSWHADHKVPWTKGGKTIVSNGQVLCVKCNLQKKDKLW